MKKLKKNVLRLEDGIEEMITDLEGASRTTPIDEKTAGAEDTTCGHSKFEPQKMPAMRWCKIKKIMEWWR